MIIKQKKFNIKLSLSITKFKLRRFFKQKFLLSTKKWNSSFLNQTKKSKTIDINEENLSYIYNDNNIEIQLILLVLYWEIKIKY